LTLQARVCLSEAADGHHELGAFDQRLQGDDLGRFSGKEVAGWEGVSNWVKMGRKMTTEIIGRW